MQKHPHSLLAFATAFVLTAWSGVEVPPLAANLSVLFVLGAYGWRRHLSAWVIAGMGVALFTIWLDRRDSPGRDAWVHAVGESRVEGELTGHVVSGPTPLPGGRYGYVMEAAKWDDRDVATRVSLIGEGVVLPGDVVRVWSRLERPPGAELPGRASSRERAGRRGIGLRGSMREEPVLLGQETSLWRPFANARRAHIEGLLDHLSASHAAHAIALTTGQKSFVSDEASELWNVSGTGHLLAISGLHFGMLGLALWNVGRWLAGFFPVAVRRFGAERTAAPIVALVLALALVWVGGPTSARRAFSLAIAAAVALGALRRVTLSRVLALSAVAVAAADPMVVRDLGYQLSFGATAAIVALLEGPLSRRPLDEAPDLGRRIWNFLVISTGASLATAPILAHHLGTIPVGGFWANLWAIPVVASIVFPLTLIGSFCAPIVPEFGYTVIEAGMRVLDGLRWTLEVTANVETQWVTGAWSAGGAGFVLLATLLFLGTSSARRRAAAGLAALVVAATQPGRAVPDELEIHAVPVGQGDATLVLFPDGGVMLIDAGGSTHGRDPGSKIVVPYLWRLGISRLDHLVVTHPDHDHVGGLPAVARNLEIGTVVRDGCLDDEAAQVVVDRAAADLRVCGAVEWGEPWRVRAVRPSLSDPSKNDRSILVELTWGPARALLTGDAEHPAEGWWLEEMGREATLLKLGHHGSKTSTSARMLEVTRPALAFASAGRFSRFGHPDPDVVARTEGSGAVVGSTSRDGLLVYGLDQNGAVTWRSVRPPPLRVQASMRRRTRSIGSSSSSGLSASTPASERIFATK